MKLRAYRITGSAMFDAVPLVHIRVQETTDTHGLVGRLLGWMLTERIYSAYRTGGATGGGFMSHHFEPADAEKIVAWLKENGAVEGISDPDGDPPEPTLKAESPAPSKPLTMGERIAAGGGNLFSHSTDKRTWIK